MQLCMNAHTIQYDLGGIGYIGMNVINVSISFKKSNSLCSLNNCPNSSLTNTKKSVYIILVNGANGNHVNNTILWNQRAFAFSSF